jgi:hypothetical protein
VSRDPVLNSLGPTRAQVCSSLTTQLRPVIALKGCVRGCGDRDVVSEEGDRRVRRLWSALEARGVTNLGTATHRKHVPHVSLTVMDRLPTQEDALTDAVRPALGKTLRLSAVGGFPGVATFLLPAHH